MIIYIVSQDKNGYWYAHRKDHACIPVFASFSKNKRIAQTAAANNMGLTLKEYLEYMKRKRMY